MIASHQYLAAAMGESSMPDIVSNLAHRWTLDGTLDAAVGGQDGAYEVGSGSTTPVYVPGLFGRALSLDGTYSQRVSLGTDASLDMQGDRSVSVLVYVPAIAATTGLLSLGPEWAQGTSLYLRTTTGQQVAATFNEGGTYYSSRIGNLPTGQWVRITATFDATTHEVKVYFDDVLQTGGATATGSVGHSADAEIGRAGGITPTLTGSIMDLRIYERVLSAGDVAALDAWRPASTGLRGRPNLSGLRGRQNIKSIGR